MSGAPVTLDMSTAKPITLDMSTAKPISSSLNPQGQAIVAGQAPPQSTPKMQPQDPTARDYYEIAKPALFAATAGAGAAGAEVAAAAAPEIETASTVAAKVLNGAVDVAKNIPLRTYLLGIAGAVNTLWEHHVANATRKEAEENAEAISEQLDQIQQSLDAKRKK